MSPERQRVTLKMIAEKAGISIGTVDRAVNNRGGVSEESKRLVLKVAEELGYRPNKFASALGRKKTVRIGMVYPEAPEEFYSDIDGGIDKAVDELQDYGVIVDKLRYPVQEAQVAEACLAEIDAKDYDGLAINAAGITASGQIDRFVNMGVPVITFNTDAPESSRLFYVGNHSTRSGLMGGEILDMLLRGRGKVTVLGNFARITPFVERFGGFCEYIQPNCPGIQIYPCSECYADTEIAAKSLLELLEQIPDISGVFCTGYSSTVGAIQALQRLNRRDICLVGYDVTERTARALREGWCNALLYQDPFRQGHQAAHLLARHVLEGWRPARPRLHVETQIVIKSNVDSYISLASPLFHTNIM